MASLQAWANRRLDAFLPVACISLLSLIDSQNELLM
jgi:hypothetical protein